ncbi:hypothetical protein ABK040_001200 [Willaertia magna]
MLCYIVDAFANNLFEGNPAAVCILKEWISDELMQNIAMENNLSETAFAVKSVNNNNDDSEIHNYHLRWFTPEGEINLCGHATLATSFVISKFYDVNTKVLKFKTLSGELIVTRKEENLFELDFPSTMPESIIDNKNISTEIMTDILGVKPIEMFLNRDIMCIIEKEEDIYKMNPDFNKMKNLEIGSGVIVTAKCEENNRIDFISRCFYPKCGVNEDPVTGSAHCSFVPYWAKKLGKNNLIARQVSKRGGTIICKYEGDRVKMSGSAVLYSVSDLQINNL